MKAGVGMGYGHGTLSCTRLIADDSWGGAVEKEGA